MAVDAVHYMLLTGTGSFRVCRSKFSHRTIVILLADPRNRLIVGVRRDVFDMTHMCAVDPAQLTELIPTANMEQHQRACDRILLVIPISRFHNQLVSGK